MFLTQRATPALGRVSTAADRETRSCSAGSLAAGTRRSSACCWNTARISTTQRPVRVWHDSVLVEDAVHEAATWLSGVIGQPCRHRWRWLGLLHVRDGVRFERVSPKPIARVRLPHPFPDRKICDALRLLLDARGRIARRNSNGHGALARTRRCAWVHFRKNVRVELESGAEFAVGKRLRGKRTAFLLSRAAVFRRDVEKALSGPHHGSANAGARHVNRCARSPTTAASSAGDGIHARTLIHAQPSHAVLCCVEADEVSIEESDDCPS